MKIKLPNGSSMYGAQMGRSNSIPQDISTCKKLYLQRLKWVDGDYDEGGAYWGGMMGDYVYCAHGESETEQVRIFVRGIDRTDAKEEVRIIVPHIKFYV